MTKVNAVIERHNCTLYYDYDCRRDNVLSQLSDDGKIEWLEQRMHMIFLRPLARLYDRASPAYQALNFPDGLPPMTPMLMAFSLLMNGVEALGSFLSRPRKSKNKNYKRFEAFMKRYMLDWTSAVKVPRGGRRKLSRIFWLNYRNALAHSFAITNDAGLEDISGTNKYRVADKVLQIDGSKFFADFVEAVARMFGDVRTKPRMRKLFLQRFNEVFPC